MFTSQLSEMPSRLQIYMSASKYTGIGTVFKYRGAIQLIFSGQVGNRLGGIVLNGTMTIPVKRTRCNLV